MTIVSNEHIALDENGVARIAGSRMKVMHLAMDKIANNSTPEEMAVAFPSLTLAEIHAALSYYYDHREEIDAQIAQSLKETDDARSHSKSQPTRAELMARLDRKSDETSRS